MTLSASPERIKRYAGIARLFYKYGSRDLVTRAGLDDALRDPGVEPAMPGTHDAAADLAADLERLGPAYVKLGQLLSTRADLLPTPYLTALSRLQDRVDSFSFLDVEQIVQDELGVRLSKAFKWFDQTPLAAASLGQVHRAVLRDGRDVAVKVQRPGAREQVAGDLSVFADVAEFLDRHALVGGQVSLAGVVEEFRRTILEELDYRREAQNLDTLRANLASFPHLLVPAPIADYSSSRVLTMEYVTGQKITAVNPVVFVDAGGPALADELFRAYLQQIIVDGFFHADPHPGNVFLTDDGRLALIDLGMVNRLSATRQDQLLKLLLTLAEGRGEAVADVVIQMGRPREDFDRAALTRDIVDLVARYLGASMKDLHVGAVMLSISRVAATGRLELPAEMTLLGKTLLNLDEIARTLAPNFDVQGTLRRHVADLMRDRVWRSFSSAGMMRSVLDFRQLLEALPARINRVVDLVSANNLKLKLEIIDQQGLIDGFQKIANRIALGLLLASLIVGAALLMQIKTTATLFGYPALAMIFFLAAAAGGGWLAIHIVRSDAPRRRRRR